VDRIVQNAELLSLDRSTGLSSGFGTGGSSTTITRTVLNSNDSGLSYGGSSGGGLLSSLISQSTRPTTSFQTISSAVRNTFGSTSSSGTSPTRRSGDQ